MWINIGPFLAIFSYVFIWFVYGNCFTDSLEKNYHLINNVNNLVFELEQCCEHLETNLWFDDLGEYVLFAM